MKTKVTTETKVKTAAIVSPAKAHAKALAAAVTAVLTGVKAENEARAALEAAEAKTKDSVINLALVTSKAFDTKDAANSYFAEKVKELPSFRRSEMLAIAFPPPAVKQAVQDEIARLRDATAAKTEGTKSDANKASVLAIARGKKKRNKKGELVDIATSADSAGKRGGHNRLSDEKKLEAVLAIYWSEKRTIAGDVYSAICFNAAAAAGQIKPDALEAGYKRMIG